MVGCVYLHSILVYFSLAFCATVPFNHTPLSLSHPHTNQRIASHPIGCACLLQLGGGGDLLVLAGIGSCLHLISSTLPRRGRLGVLSQPL